MLLRDCSESAGWRITLSREVGSPPRLGEIDVDPPASIHLPVEPDAVGVRLRVKPPAR